MSKSKLVLYHAGFKSHLKFDENKENLESDNSTLEPLENLVLADLETTDDDNFEIRTAFLGWCSLFLHTIRNQKCELYNLCYNSVCKSQTLKTNCKLQDPFDLKSLKCNNNETYLVCNDRRVKCWPKNNFTKELIEVDALMDDTEEQKSRVKQISVGNSFVCALLDTGLVKVMDEKGKSIDFRLDGDEFDYVSCGLEFVLLLTKKGNVYGFGSNQKGQLGLSELTDVKEDCRLIEALEGLKVGQISAGGWHSLVLENGSVYSFGWNSHGQLGIESAELKTAGICETPTLVNLPGDLEFIMVKAGSRHSMAVSSEGLLFVWGWNKYDQLGFKVTDLSEIRIPKQLPLNGKVVSIECKFWSSLVQIYYP